MKTQHHISFPLFALRLCVLCVLCTLPITAQTPPDKNYRRVFWIHDINEDDLSSELNAPKSAFWRNYAGETRINAGINPCPDVGTGHFIVPNSYKMNASLLNYYTDRPIPAGKYAVTTNGSSLTRQKQGNSQSATMTANTLHNTIKDVPIGEQPLPFVIAHGTGVALATNIHRRFATENLFGGIISVGAAHNGLPLISSISNGKLEGFEKGMYKAFNAGYEKYAEKVEAKIFSTAVSLGLGFIGVDFAKIGKAKSELSVGDFLKEALKKTRH